MNVDPKVSRVFVAAVTARMQKILRQDKGKDPDALVADLERLIDMIKMVGEGKKKKSKKTKKKDVAPVVVTPVVVST